MFTQIERLAFWRLAFAYKIQFVKIPIVKHLTGKTIFTTHILKNQKPKANSQTYIGFRNF